jgi:hypothetical protein
LVAKTNIENCTIQGKAHVATPGATAEQAAAIYQACAMGNEKAQKSGNMGLWAANDGLFAATNGIFNAENGINHNILM